MATSTFDRKITISNPASLKRLEESMNDNSPVHPISEHPFSIEERKYGEELLHHCKLRASDKSNK